MGAAFDRKDAASFLYSNSMIRGELREAAREGDPPEKRSTKKAAKKRAATRCGASGPIGPSRRYIPQPSGRRRQ